jgi:hypothetical protein
MVWLWGRLQVTANFYEALRCCEVVGLAGAERIPCLSSYIPTYTTICYCIIPYPPVVSLQSTTQKNTRVRDTLCSQYYGET